MQASWFRIKFVTLFERQKTGKSGEHPSKGEGQGKIFKF